MSEKNTTINYMLNKSLVGKMPAGATQRDWQRFHTSWQFTASTAIELARNIYRGWAFCPVFEGRKRRENYVGAWHVAFDFDHDGIEAVKSMPLVDYFASFVYSTPSSTPENPRCRAVFVFPQPVNSADEYADIYKALAWQFGLHGLETDPACKDVLRIYYGSPRCDMWHNWSILPLSSAREYVTQWRDAVVSENEFRPKPVKATPANEMPARFLEIAADKLLNNVRAAPDGQKHYTLRKIAYVFGGYVANGYYSRDNAIGWLEDAIRSRAADMSLASRTIRDCLTAGMAEPLGFSAETNTRQRNGYDLRSAL
ncbi:MAG: hypothetical protein M9930_19565 [Anaerolineae bacterium]|nr:hypothetical protein [Anaerolineae bacterium]